MSKTAKKPAVVRKLRMVRSESIRGHRVGRIVGIGPQGWLVDFPGNQQGPVLARTTLTIEPSRFQEAADRSEEALLVFENERASLPIVVGLLKPSEAAVSAPTQSPVALATPHADAHRVEASVDGQRVIVEGRDEIVLRCGLASITLRRNGRVIIRGTYVETRAQGVNRVKGGSVQIN